MALLAAALVHPVTNVMRPSLCPNAGAGGTPQHREGKGRWRDTLASQTVWPMDAGPGPQLPPPPPPSPWAPNWPGLHIGHGS